MTKSEENNKLLNMYRASYEMYENTIKDTIEHLKGQYDKEGKRVYTDEQIEDRLKIIREAQKGVYDNYVEHGGNPEELVQKKRKRNSKISKMASKIQEEINTGIENTAESEPVHVSASKEKDEKILESISPNKVLDYIPKKNSFETHETFDIIPLPSKGECYKTKTSKMPVSYLTAYDENMIIAPNLYRDKLIIDTILEQKIMSDEIAPGDLLEGDRDAIILFLRASGYGNEYPITATDNVTGEQFDAVVDLSQIEYKPFKLKGDANGYFDYELPLSKDIVKFRFLSHQNNLDLLKFEEMENEVLKKARLNYFAGEIEDFIDNDNVLEKQEKAKVHEAIRTLEGWADKIDEDELLYTHAVTNRLEMSVMSVNGITDRDYIKRYVRNMNVKDSSALRKYINDNEPGLDYNVTVERPESLGGGSMPVFLQLDQLVFLNIA